MNFDDPEPRAPLRCARGYRTMRCCTVVAPDEAKRSRGIASIVVLLFAVGCAHDVTLPAPDGEEFAPGMYGFDSTRSEFEPWAPAFAYPALENQAPPIDGEPLEELSAPQSVAASGPTVAAAWLWFSAYKQTLSRVDGNTCRFSPSCSAFGFEAIQRHGPYGVVMTFGRLHKNHSADRHYPMSRPPFLDDPVVNYDFTSRRPALDDFDAYDDPAHAWYQHVRATQSLD